MVISHSAQNLFNLNKNQFYIYGEEGRRKMYSVLFNLEYSGQQEREQILYKNNVLRSLDVAKSLQTDIEE